MHPMISFCLFSMYRFHIVYINTGFFKLQLIYLNLILKKCGVFLSKSLSRYNILNREFTTGFPLNIVCSAKFQIPLNLFATPKAVMHKLFL